MTNALYLDKISSVTPKARAVLIEKATEFPHTADYNQVQSLGTYLCRRCGIALFRAHSQFDAGCGWPSFDTQVCDTVQEIPDADGFRLEIICKRCCSHLGHVFEGEHLTENNRRYCVNGLALDYVIDNTLIDSEEVIVAGGCFWGVDYYLRRHPGVVQVEVGYCGGSLAYPSYEAVCQGNTGHLEAVRVIFDNTKTSFLDIIKLFFNIHDPTQPGGQGPDSGSQYQSAIFYYNAAQKAIALNVIQQLIVRHYQVVTQLLPVTPFWRAELAHQSYYQKHHQQPYCHCFTERLV